MLHPNQFKVNEAWILFRLNQGPLRTDQDGDFNCVALMDAASCFLLGVEMIPVSSREPKRAEFRRLLKNAERHKEQLPQTLFIPLEDVADLASREAAARKIDVVRVSEAELLSFIAEARRGFAERFRGSPP